MGWISLGMRLFPFIVEAVNWVEKFVSGRGVAKQDAAVYMIKAGLGVVENAVDRDILNDEEVEAATRKVIDAYVALQNLIARR